jgi:8-oxo-dGTP pyrophosphatase MutT (NUDIX family)
LGKKDVQLFAVQDVSEDFPFEPQCPGEIESYRWFGLNYLEKVKNPEVKTTYDPKSFEGVYPFLDEIKLWIDKQPRKTNK